MTQSMKNTSVTLRQLVIGQVQAIPEQLFDIQPEGFNHTIRWNVGHIVHCLSAYLSLGMPFDSRLPESYAGLFASGTKPSEWTAIPPTKEELIQYLSAQLASLSTVSPEGLGESLKTLLQVGPLTFEMVGELFNFVLVHEAIHLGMISSLAKVVSTK